MKIEFGNNLTLSFAFHHETKRRRKSGTTVFVKLNGMLVLQTRSHLDSRDIFTKEQGRKKAIRKALVLMETPFVIPQSEEEKKAKIPPVMHDPIPLNKEQRSHIWNEYALMTKKSWANG